MKFTFSWLKEHLQTDAALPAIVEALTKLGLEVEGVDDPAAKLAGFTVAKVLTAAPHPQADKLQVLTVDTGDGDALQVVCGAPNARAGLVGVFGAPGTYVPGSGITLKVAAIRGVESNGMMCSMRELELSDAHEGIIELPADAPVGTSYADYAGLSDPVIDVAITPNRQDCMGVRGIARDLAAAGIGTLKPLAVPSIRASEPCPVAIATLDPEGCPAFFGRVVNGVANGTSPDWMQRRLTAIGQRPISALVDITNYVMFDLGRPLHVYDVAKLQGGLVARKALAGETLVALNGKSYALDPEMTVIADAAHVHDIGGIMGGIESGVSETTTDVLIECAYFTPETIARTGQKLGLTSDARQRFERGVDPAFLHDGLAIATALVIDLCGGTPTDAVEAGKAPTGHPTFSYDPLATQKLGGIEVAADTQRAILARLGFGIDGSWTVRVPSWRRDVEGTPDIVEEIVRIVGLDTVPAVALPRSAGVAKPTATPGQRIERLVRRTAAARGLNEAVTWSFLPAAEAERFGGGAWTLANPISEDMKVMRPSLLPGLLAAARRNADRGADTIRLFEIGRRYLADGERATLGLLLAGEAAPREWLTRRKGSFDAFDAKAEALALLAAAGAPIDRLQVMEPVSAAWHPGRSGTLRLGPKTVLAEFGELHPATLKAFGLERTTVAAELYLDAVPARREAGRMRSAYAPPMLQPVTRDFAFVVGRDQPADALLRAVRGADKAAIVDVALFDLFEGTGLAEDEKSLAIAVTLQPVEKSFTDAELQAISDRVVAAAAKLGARLRG
ncbi:phenylalanine--tRNA ligase subunit beta [Sphingomonas nostoxanthinifaciens]|uniref:phenylalanine--tRNA ligase subunit beta n=1 Tax=Sphingomonas nostoxanthinifaciens TaxID=2872652 RepID=UPI001CC1F9C3|nr:phenylalanine--tRNA ligase subunit beta [Sphingomonas nostoxanthinifaciens]UAK25160.1 phenylalanine--tRNA ligase subunit beta [Sphingomonas nostoxanthinifaciens]